MKVFFPISLIRTQFLTAIPEAWDTCNWSSFMFLDLYMYTKKKSHPNYWSPIWIQSCTLKHWPCNHLELLFCFKIHLWRSINLYSSAFILLLFSAVTHSINSREPGSLAAIQAHSKKWGGKLQFLSFFLLFSSYYSSMRLSLSYLCTQEIVANSNQPSYL